MSAATDITHTQWAAWFAELPKRLADYPESVEPPVGYADANRWAVSYADGLKGRYAVLAHSSADVEVPFTDDGAAVGVLQEIKLYLRATAPAQGGDAS